MATASIKDLSVEELKEWAEKHEKWPVELGKAFAGKSGYDIYILKRWECIELIIDKASQTETASKKIWEEAINPVTQLDINPYNNPVPITDEGDVEPLNGDTLCLDDESDDDYLGNPNKIQPTMDLNSTTTTTTTGVSNPYGNQNGSGDSQPNPYGNQNTTKSISPDDDLKSNPYGEQNIPDKSYKNVPRGDNDPKPEDIDWTSIKTWLTSLKLAEHEEAFYDEDYDEIDLIRSLDEYAVEDMINATQLPVEAATIVYNSLVAKPIENVNPYGEQKNDPEKKNAVQEWLDEYKLEKFWPQFEQKEMIRVKYIKASPERDIEDLIKYCKMDEEETKRFRKGLKDLAEEPDPYATQVVDMPELLKELEDDQMDPYDLNLDDDFPTTESTVFQHPVASDATNPYDLQNTTTTTTTTSTAPELTVNPYATTTTTTSGVIGFIDPNTKNPYDTQNNGNSEDILNDSGDLMANAGLSPAEAKDVMERVEKESPKLLKAKEQQQAEAELNKAAEQLEKAEANDEERLKEDFKTWCNESKLEKHFEQFETKRYDTLQVMLMLTIPVAEKLADEFEMKAGTKAKFTMALKKLHAAVDNRERSIPRKKVRMQTKPMDMDWEPSANDIDLSKEFSLDGRTSFERTVKLIKTQRHKRKVDPFFYIKSTSRQQYFSFRVAYFGRDYQ